ncbi:tRNA adenosine(34) deaminase TadA [Methylonatrum kenyense]|uniref:tRNA adenosine(34) deaminase TadA n=1 Tax=Methylonatrum kenyense TaxID=455253 RepID=UPI00209B1BC4|nr:tRNA adenosine(34) deaminase TadA [Methylonatrum kenyense]MCK8515571.1 tRNA adenosine(34) deaminase TadA [Methylonatrum kenyense]
MTENDRRDQDVRWMQQALELARQAAAEDEVPVGAVLVRGGELLASGYNHPIAASDPSAHAEMACLRDAARRTGNYRLTGTTLYVTLEPCVMCVGALVHARVQRLVYAAPEPRTGAVESRFQLLADGLHNHLVEVESGLLADESARLLREFFRARRQASS